MSENVVFLFTSRQGSCWAMERHIKLGVLEKLPGNNDDLVCRMMVVEKLNGSISMAHCIDFKGLKKVGKRQFHVCMMPFFFFSSLCSVIKLGQ